MCLRERVLGALLSALACAALPAAATARDYDNIWLLNIGGDVEAENGYRIDAGLTWAPSELTAIYASAGTADVSTDFDEFTYQGANLGFDHFFGPIGLIADLRWWDQSELFSTTTLGASLYFRSHGWRIALRGEARESEFDEFSFDTVIPVRGVLVPISGRGECSLDNTAYGLSANYTGAAWTALLSGINYEYSSTDCNLNGATVPPQVGNLPPISREIFRRIATRVLESGARLIGSQLTRENGFLDYSIWANLGYRSGLTTFGLDYYHDREEFAGLEADTLIGSITFPIGDRLDLELRLGATDSDLEGNVAFGGFTLFAYIGGTR